MKTIEERAVIHANKFDKEIGVHHYSYCIGATEQKEIDDKAAFEERGKAFKAGEDTAIEEAWEWIEGWVFENAPHEVFDELMSSRQDYNKAMGE